MALTHYSVRYLCYRYGFGGELALFLSIENVINAA